MTQSVIKEDDLVQVVTLTSGEAILCLDRIWDPTRKLRKGPPLVMPEEIRLLNTAAIPMAEKGLKVLTALRALDNFCYLHEVDRATLTALLVALPDTAKTGLNIKALSISNMSHELLMGAWTELLKATGLNQATILRELAKAQRQPGESMVATIKCLQDLMDMYADISVDRSMAWTELAEMYGRTDFLGKEYATNNARAILQFRNIVQTAKPGAAQGIIRCWKRSLDESLSLEVTGVAVDGTSLPAMGQGRSSNSGNGQTRGTTGRQSGSGTEQQALPRQEYPPLPTVIPATTPAFMGRWKCRTCLEMGHSSPFCPKLTMDLRKALWAELVCQSQRPGGLGRNRARQRASGGRGGGGGSSGTSGGNGSSRQGTSMPATEQGGGNNNNEAPASECSDVVFMTKAINEMPLLRAEASINGHSILLGIDSHSQVSLIGADVLAQLAPAAQRRVGNWNLSGIGVA
jgi:hypothetical protein